MAKIYEFKSPEPKSPTRVAKFDPLEIGRISLYYQENPPAEAQVRQLKKPVPDET